HSRVYRTWPAAPQTIGATTPKPDPARRRRSSGTLRPQQTHQDQNSPQGDNLNTRRSKMREPARPTHPSPDLWSRLRSSHPILALIVFPFAHLCSPLHQEDSLQPVHARGECVRLSLFVAQDLVLRSRRSES